MNLKKFITYPFRVIYADIYNLYAFFLIKKNNFDKASKILDHIVNLDVRHYYIFNNIAYIEFIANKDLQAAEKALEKAKMTKPDYFITIVNYSYLYLKQEKYEKALELLTYFLTSKKNSHAKKLCLNNKAVALIRLKRYDEALETISELLKKNKKMHIALYNRGFILNKKGRHEEAKKDIEYAIKYGKDPKYYYSLALLNLKTNNIKDATEALKTYADKYPHAAVFDENIEEWHELLCGYSEDDKKEIGEIIAKLPIKTWKDS